MLYSPASGFVGGATKSMTKGFDRLGSNDPIGPRTIYDYFLTWIRRLSKAMFTAWRTQIPTAQLALSNESADSLCGWFASLVVAVVDLRPGASGVYSFVPEDQRLGSPDCDGDSLVIMASTKCINGNQNVFPWVFLHSLGKVQIRFGFFLPHVRSVGFPTSVVKLGLSPLWANRWRGPVWASLYYCFCSEHALHIRGYRLR